MVIGSTIPLTLNGAYKLTLSLPAPQSNNINAVNLESVTLGCLVLSVISTSKRDTMYAGSGKAYPAAAAIPVAKQPLTLVFTEGNMSLETLTISWYIFES